MHHLRITTLTSDEISLVEVAGQPTLTAAPTIADVRGWEKHNSCKATHGFALMEDGTYQAFRIGKDGNQRFIIAGPTLTKPEEIQSAEEMQEAFTRMKPILWSTEDIQLLPWSPKNANLAAEL